MRVLDTALPEVKVVEPAVFEDERGRFFEVFRGDRFAEAGLPGRFVQDNVSVSKRGVIRGLHLQHPHAQSKLVCAVRGEVFDVAVDVRLGSPNFGRWVGQYLSATDARQLFVPAGFAHGFAVVSDEAIVMYKCTDSYHPESERTIRWDDPTISIDWPVQSALLSPRDKNAPRLADMPRESLPVYAG